MSLQQTPERGQGVDELSHSFSGIAIHRQMRDEDSTAAALDIHLLGNKRMLNHGTIEGIGAL